MEGCEAHAGYVREILDPHGFGVVVPKPPDPEILLGPVGGALVQRFGPRQAHVAFRRIRRRAGSEPLNGGAALMLAASAIAIGLSRSALNFDPAKTQVRR